MFSIVWLCVHLTMLSIFLKVNVDVIRFRDHKDNRLASFIQVTFSLQMTCVSRANHYYDLITPMDDKVLFYFVTGMRSWIAYVIKACFYFKIYKLFM